VVTPNAPDRLAALLFAPMRVIFLFGSGISIDAGMPGVSDISEQVFGGVGVVRHSDATYYIAGSESGNYDHHRVEAESAIGFAAELRTLADRYFHGWLDQRDASYEDVANLAKQIGDALLPVATLERVLRGSGMSVEDWCRALNRRTFFFVSERPLSRLLNAYGNEEHDVLVLDARKLVDRYEEDVWLSAINTGAIRPAYAKRGPDTFVRVRDYPSTPTGRPANPSRNSQSGPQFPTSQSWSSAQSGGVGQRKNERSLRMIDGRSGYADCSSSRSSSAAARTER
jgi:hypothetical protein